MAGGGDVVVSLFLSPSLSLSGAGLLCGWVVCVCVCVCARVCVSAWGQILIESQGWDSARGAGDIERLRPNSIWEVGDAGCTGRMLNPALEAGFQ